jgi:hypothetical protein
MHARLANEAISINPSLVHHALLESEMSDLCGFDVSGVISRKQPSGFFAKLRESSNFVKLYHGLKY